MTVYKFVYNQHPTNSAKDTYSVEEYFAREFKHGYVLTDEYDDEVAVIGKTSLGVLNGTHMYLLENKPKTFIEALAKRTQENIEFHTHHLETLLQRKMRCSQILKEAENTSIDCEGGDADEV